MNVPTLKRASDLCVRIDRLQDDIKRVESSEKTTNLMFSTLSREAEFIVKKTILDDLNQQLVEAVAEFEKL